MGCAPARFLLCSVLSLLYNLTGKRLCFPVFRCGVVMMREIHLEPGETLVVRVADVNPGPDGEPDGPDEGLSPEIGETLAAFGFRAAGEEVGPDHEKWPKGPDGDPVPGTHVWDGTVWVPQS